MVHSSKELLKKKRKAIEEKNSIHLAESCSSLGNLFNERGEHDKALVEFKSVVRAYKDLNKNIEMATAHRMIGETYSEMVNFELALKHINIYLSKYEKLLPSTQFFLTIQYFRNRANREKQSRRTTGVRYVGSGLLVAGTN
jgi:tetratricopeptide (TPR) repeat protein